MSRIIPIPTLHLFPRINSMLVELLRSLSPEDWNKPTLAGQWTVKDVAAHLLDTSMRTVSLIDGHNLVPDREINSYRDLVGYLNDLNGTWVRAMKRISPQQIIQMLENADPRGVEYYRSLDPFAPALYSVAWAGEELSMNWFHIARDYTEKWHHQQQIREAVGKTAPLMTRELFYPCIDTFMQGLPHTYRDVVAEPGTTIKIIITGEAGGDWLLAKTNANWILDKTCKQAKIEASVSLEPAIAWKLFTKGITPGSALETTIISGDGNLAAIALQMISVMA
ncbi:maleylpyruvate isomerase N-terminal domain-containing protein [Mucilaginibacter sp.]|uniref:maleylpyruvate isomerase N-terminal domain-containing protein n=1 Tax=Mucilaginibacter sp. TaxID=1882438 RepID=UPI002BFC923E|nr:maleylpyruvate isomerase N-terminal domain-containing protein [Mucilaginibacter sp.]HTI61457.1 maleylpyruvate isomerase N-terminal domain-containing protein [Mucilaginibacter sp.]